MTDESMAKVRVTRDVTIHPDQTVNIIYPAGYEGTAPHAHIELITKAGAGERIGTTESAKTSLADKIASVVVGQ